MPSSDLDKAKRVYSSFGFSVVEGGRHPGGTENSVARFSLGGYLELITRYDASLPDGGRIAKDLTMGDGPVVTGLEVASAEQSSGGPFYSRTGYRRVPCS